jgi:hypothetical protein
MLGWETDIFDSKCVPVIGPLNKELKKRRKGFEKIRVPPNYEVRLSSMARHF